MSHGKRVVIVGAGPAGLVAALGLARIGAQVTVIDQEKKINDSPRAFVYLPSTTQVIDELGLLDDAKALGEFGYEYQQRFARTGNIGTLDYHLIEKLTPYAYTLHFGQDVLAQMVLEHFLKCPGAKLRWATAFTGLQQAPDSVLVSVNTESGPETIEADWVIGADGARSSVRKALGLEFEGFTWPETFMATNVFYDFEKYGYAPSNMIADPVDWRVIARIDKRQLWRIAYGEDSELTEEQRRARIADRFRKFLPEWSGYEIERANSYRVHQRSASSFRVGRVLLTGDAAHATNPIGGMGFTSGVHDSKMLIESLASIMNGQADHDVLDWYSYERRRIFLELVNPTAIEFKRRVQEADPVRRAADETAFLNMTKDPQQVQQALMSVFQLHSRPYQPDWRTTLVKQDKRAALDGRVVRLSGTDVTAAA